MSEEPHIPTNDDFCEGMDISKTMSGDKDRTMKLFTMVEYIDSLIPEITTCSLGDAWELAKNNYYRICEYKDFLKSKPEAWMFTPCDADGNELKEPDYWKWWNENDKPVEYILCKQYEEAKDRVVFEGFQEEWGDSFELLVNFTRDMGNDTFEDLARYSSLYLTITEGAIKKFRI
jgi:hypothetical protein